MKSLNLLDVLICAGSLFHRRLTVGVALVIDDRHGYSILEKASNEAFQALWVEISFVQKKIIICGIVYWQHNSPERFQKYFEETIEKFVALDKQICVLGDFNIDLLKAQSSNYSHDFLLSLQNCYLIPIVDKPTRVRSTSATFRYQRSFLTILHLVLNCRSTKGKK